MNGTLAIGLLSIRISYLCTSCLRTSLYCIDNTTLNISYLRLVAMNLGFLLGVNDHRLVINLSNFQFSHLLL